MAYQALLFCPDEKTARTVTQVLSELDFAVAPCTEPFAAVKRLMAEHFDAVVVDCDNEQNATLLFKSAHNSALNQSSLAVAVVEGQAGVAKAFRIGANLVLTKPINVEQAKGTLRVARGLLRKGEAAKSAGSAAAAPAAVPTATAPKPAPRPVVPASAAPRTATPMAPRAPASPKPWIPAPQPVVASDSAPVAEAEEAVLNEVREHTPSAVSAAPKSDASILDSGAVKSAVKEKIAPAPAPAVGASGTGAASAPARARSAEASVPPTLPEPAVDKETEEDIAALRAASEVGEVAEPSFTFGGNATADVGGGRKKALLGIVAVLVVAAAGYATWTQFLEKPSAPTPVAARPVSQTSVPAPGGTTATQSTSASAPAAVPASGISTPEDQQGVTTSSPSSAAEAQPTNSEDEEPTHSASTVPPKASHPSSTPSSKAGEPAKPAPQPIVLKNGSSAPVAPVPPPTADVPAPNPLAMAAAGSSGLPNLTANETTVPKPVLQTVNVSQGVSQGLLYKKVQPIYPSSALRMRVEGDVELLATISAHGEIASVKIMSGTPVLAHAAADAVKQWKYKPYLLDGKPVDIQTQITVKFKLPQ
jgi:periplasmic protein TonB